MTTVKWYLCSTGPSLILLNLSEAHQLALGSLHILILELSIIQLDIVLGVLHFAMRFCIKVF